MQNPDQVLTAAQMRAAEDALIAQGCSVSALMDRAGRGAAEWVWRVAAGRPVTVLCGPGNNGGDGYVIAEVLRARGIAVTIVAPDEPRTQAASEARAAYGGQLVREGGTSRGGVFVDCLFGSGLSRRLSEEHAALLNALARQHEISVAIDLPSGVSTDDGALMGAVRRYELTLALGAWKPAHFLMPALETMGGLHLVDIGIGTVPGAARIFPRPHFHAPLRAAHKYSRGLVGVVAGAMPGAALLSATAAMRAGAGYVKLLGADVPAGHPAALVIDPAPLAEALSDPRWTGMLVGPGLGRDAAAREKLGLVLERGLPTTLDADALHLLDDDLLEGIDRSRLLVTPHGGELVKLCQTFGVGGASKPEQALALAQTAGLTVLAKGPDTILAAPDGRVAYFPSAPTWLASAGTGDVLAGIAASRMAAGRAAFEAAGEAVWLHAEAARMAGPVLIADDLVAALSDAVRRFM